jgi:hypothetical protein
MLPTPADNSAPRRRRFLPLVWLASAVAALVVALGVSGTLSGFTASIQNTTNTAATGTLLMTETGVTNATGSCYSNGTVNGAPDSNAGTCATINKFGGSTTMAPGVAGPAVTVSLTDNGTINAAAFSLTPGATCAQSTNGAVNGSATDLCTKLNVTISNGTGTSGDLYTGTLAGLAGHAAFTLTALNAGSSASFTFQVTLASGAGNSYQGLKASLPLTWAFTQ